MTGDWQALITQLGAIAVATIGAIVAVENRRRLGKPNGKGNVVEMSEAILHEVGESRKEVGELRGEVGSLRGAFDERGKRFDALQTELETHGMRIGRVEGVLEALK